MHLDRKPRPSLTLADPAGAPGPALALGRAHEATGPAAWVFAALVASRLSGPVLWIRPAWSREAPHPEGVAPFFDPARLVFVDAPRPLDVLWAAEEALRSGAAPFVIAEAAEPPALTPLRRLQLAAEAGGAGAKGAVAPPLCLILPPRPGSAGAVESRWRCDPLPAWGPAGPDAPPRWRFERSYGKSGPPLEWLATGASASAPLQAA
ncbi:MAG: hypothetical protein AAGF90_15850 [Pseudomonadota bacterium]